MSIKIVGIFLLIVGLTACIKELQQHRLIDMEGEPLRLKEEIRDWPIVLIFLATDCPISQKYTKTLRDLAGSYPSIQFVGIMTKWEKEEDIRQFKESYDLPFPLLRDSRHRLVADLEAKVTPEVFVFNKKQELMYSGAIDNWFYGLGKYRPQVTETFLVDALNALLAGKPVAVSRTEPIGCEIEQ